MDAIDILGSILGQKASKPGSGADILKDILGGARRTSEPSGSREVTPNEVDRQARELEDLLNVANERNQSRTPAPAPQRQPAPTSRPSAQPAPRPGGFDVSPDDAAERQNQQALILLRAMVNAAKCDGQISQAEQQAILSRLGNPTPEAIQFLRDEFDKPLDVHEFVWSVPVGMEQSVYSVSLIAIEADTSNEQAYLRDLARGLRLSPEVCAQIKDRVAGTAFQSVGVRSRT